MRKQKTILKKIKIKSETLHIAKESELTLSPAPCNTGIIINGLKLSPIYITKTYGMTTHGSISQTEHLLSALFILGINNLYINVTENEIPILDGCNKYIIDEILKVGIQEYESPIEYYFPKKKYEYRDGDSYICYEPHLDDENLSMDFYCDVDFPYVGKQSFKLENMDFTTYYNNIANSITFFWDKQYEYEFNNGNCRGINEKNCLIYNEKTKLNNNELAKHKLLDLIGDINVFNRIIPGKFRSYKGGHRINNNLVMKIWFDYVNSNYNASSVIPYIKISQDINLENLMFDIKIFFENKNF